MIDARNFTRTQAPPGPLKTLETVAADKKGAISSNTGGKLAKPAWMGVRHLELFSWQAGLLTTQ